MAMTRRDVITGLAAMPAAIHVLGQAAGDEHSHGKIMGPAVFNWNDMTAKKTATGEVRSLCKTPTATSISWRCT